MLNRIYIVVGMLAIIVLAAAFLAPRFIQWGDYRDRMQVLASSVLGAEVTIRGDIEFSLLPQPRLSFTDVVVGQPEHPTATVEEVEAEFALMDFLRDNYNVTSLVLRDPVVNLAIDDNGLFGSGVDISSGDGVALEHARIENGAIRLADARSQEVFGVSGIDGDLKLSSFVGPFQFQGTGQYDAARYSISFNSGTLASSGDTRISSYFEKVGGGSSLTTEGVFGAGAAPKFDGKLVYRQSPGAASTADDIRGDMVFESSLELSTDRAVLSGYTLHPDENRAGMRLTGSANIQLGARRSFDAVVSGGVFSLPPRAATEVASELPYEVVRMLSEIPAPPIPPMPGKLGIDLAEVGLRGFALRNVRLDATTDGSTWTIDQAVADMPGDTELRLSGSVTNNSGQIGFQGQVRARSERLDALAQLWRRPREDNPLFNMPASLEGRVILSSDALGLTGGQFTFAGETHGVEVRLGYGEEKRLDVVAHFADLDQTHTTALLALLPDAPSDPSFRISFPQGSFSLTATGLDVMGLNAANLVAEGQWADNGVRFTRLSAANWGGLALSAKLDLLGLPGEPKITGSGQVRVESPDAEGLQTIYEMANVPYRWQQGLDRSLPADLKFMLSDQDSGGGQVLTLGGSLGAGALDLRLDMTGGLMRLASGDLRLVASLEGDDGAALTEQLGLGSDPVFTGTDSMLASLFLEGSLADGFEGRVTASQNSETIGFFGKLALSSSGQVSGSGKIEASLEEADGLANLAGARGAGLGSLSANSDISFDGGGRLTLDNIDGTFEGERFWGTVGVQQVAQLPSVTGALDFDALDATALGSALLGRAALVGAGDVLWPEGPLAMNETERASRGDLAITAQALRIGAETGAGVTAFHYVWQPQSVGIKSFQSSIGDGTLKLEVDQCCAGALAERTLSGSIGLESVDIARLLPSGDQAGLSGVLSGSLQFSGAGNSLADVMRAMTGEGNFNLASFSARGLDPDVYATINGLDDALNTDASTLEALIGVALGKGDFTAEQAQGAFSVAGGVARLNNLIVEGPVARLTGSLSLALDNLGLAGSFVMTPRETGDANALVQPDTARIITRLAGTLLAPSVTLDLSEIVAAIQVRANEIEVDRLEQLRLADEARQKAAAEERNRLIEEQKRQAAEEAARKAAEEAARQQQLQENTPPSSDTNVAPGGLDLGFQPGVNQSIGDPVNQPLNLLPN